MRTIKVQIEATARTCSECAWLDDGECTLFTEGCLNNILRPIGPALDADYLRCEQCLEAEAYENNKI